MSAETTPPGTPHVRLVKGSETPGYRTRILVVDRDPSAVAMLRSVLRAQGWEVVSGRTAADALSKARLEAPDAIILELHLSDMSGIEVTRQLRQQSGTADTPIIILSSSTGVSERVACLKAGATDYLVKPADAQDLIARLGAALDLRKDKAGFVIAVVGSKGGVGASMVTTNLAVALRREARRSVAVVDAALPTGTLDIMLNLQSGANVGHLLPRLDELERPDFEALLTHHVSGIEALLLQDIDTTISAEGIRKVLLALRHMRDIILVDAGALLDDETTAVLSVADRVLLVITPEITSLRGARVFVEQSRQAGLPRERILLVLNRSPLRGGLGRRDIENALGAAAQEAIPDDVKLVTYSINRGVPVVESHKHSGVSRHLVGLAKSLVTVIQQQ